MKKVISIILAALMLLSAVAISFSASAATGISDGGMRHIVCNDAQIATVSQVAFTECGFYIGTSPTSLTKIVEKSLSRRILQYGFLFVHGGKSFPRQLHITGKYI